MGTAISSPVEITRRILDGYGIPEADTDALAAAIVGQLREPMLHVAQARADSDQAGLRVERDGLLVMLAQARRWIETCIDPIAVGPMRKQAMLDYLDGKRSVPDFETIPSVVISQQQIDELHAMWTEAASKLSDALVKINKAMGRGA